MTQKQQEIKSTPTKQEATLWRLYNGQKYEEVLVVHQQQKPKLALSHIMLAKWSFEKKVKPEQLRECADKEFYEKGLEYLEGAYACKPSSDA